jgi:hypothetical protein
LLLLIDTITRALLTQPGWDSVNVVKMLKIGSRDGAKCEISDLMVSCDFSTKKPPWVGDFGTVIKNSKLFRFSHDFEVFSAKIVSLCMLRMR